MPIAELINMILGERINAALRESCLKTDKDILEKGIYSGNPATLKIKI